MAKGLLHIGIVVKNLEEAEKFYCDCLGFKVQEHAVLEDRGMRVSIIPVSDTTFIELLEPLHEKSNISKFIEKKGPGMHHICFEVENIEESISSLQDKGISFIDKKPSKGLHDLSVSFIHPKSSNGVLVELAEQSKK